MSSELGASLPLSNAVDTIFCGLGMHTILLDNIQNGISQFGDVDIDRGIWIASVLLYSIKDREWVDVLPSSSESSTSRTTTETDFSALSAKADLTSNMMSDL